MTEQFPFITDETEDSYLIIAEIESKQLYPKYYDFFKAHGYEGNGYCWEGHIEQILESLNLGLLEQIEFDSEAGAFYAYANSKQVQQNFVSILSPIFSDLVELRKWVDKADRKRIDD